MCVLKLTTHLHLVARQKNGWTNTSTTLYIFMVWYFIKHNGNIQFYLRGRSFWQTDRNNRNKKHFQAELLKFTFPLHALSVLQILCFSCLQSIQLHQFLLLQPSESHTIPYETNQSSKPTPGLGACSSKPEILPLFTVVFTCGLHFRFSLPFSSFWNLGRCTDLCTCGLIPISSIIEHTMCHMSPKYFTFSGCTWKRWALDMVARCEYAELWTANKGWSTTWEWAKNAP
jgi:hypothetical protein